MTTHPEFGTAPAWLLDHRGLGARELADRAGSGEGRVRAVLAGEGLVGDCSDGSRRHWASTPSTCSSWRGWTFLRACVCNHRTTPADLDVLLHEVTRAVRHHET